MPTAQDIPEHVQRYERVEGRHLSVCPSSSSSSLPRVDSRVTPQSVVQHIYPLPPPPLHLPPFLLPSRGRIHCFTIFQARESRSRGREKEKEGSRASAFIAGNGIKARWKRASVVFCGLDGRIRRMDVGRLARIYPSIHPRRNSEQYGGYIFSVFVAQATWTYLS